MRSFVVLVVLLGVLAFVPGCGVGGCDDPTPVVPDGGAGTAAAMSAGESLWAARLFELVNEARAAHGLEPYRWDPRAAEAAYVHAFDMDARDYFGHLSPDGDAVGNRLLAQGVVWASCAENLAMDYTTPEAVVAAWMASPGHRGNVLDPLYTHTGIAIHSSPDGGPWWVQEIYR